MPHAKAHRSTSLAVPWAGILPIFLRLPGPCLQGKFWVATRKQLPLNENTQSRYLFLTSGMQTQAI
jgi:hypothetical protein